jgi:hypothetical protein
MIYLQPIDHFVCHVAPSLPITPMARLGVSATPRTSRPTPRSPRASRSVDQIAMLRRTSITKAATPGTIFSGFIILLFSGWGDVCDFLVIHNLPGLLNHRWA